MLRWSSTGTSPKSPSAPSSRTTSSPSPPSSPTLVVLEGDPAYYGRLRFEYAVPHGIHISLPELASPEAAQIGRLTAYDPSIRGRLVYPPAFDGLDQ